MLVQYINLLKK